MKKPRIAAGLRAWEETTEHVSPARLGGCEGDHTSVPTHESVLRAPVALDVAKAWKPLRCVECGSEIEMNESDNFEKAVAISSLSDAQLIYILQRAADDDEGEELTQFVEAEIARRKIQGGALQ
jgi:hypothetical protein